MIRRRLYIEWAVVALATGLIVWLAATNARLKVVDNRIYDVASRLVAPPADDRILIVEIDDPSLRALGRWPWPRSEHARMLNRLASYKPAAVAYDVLFLDQSEGNAALASALRAARPVFLPALAERDATGRMTASILPPPLLAEAVSGVGTVELEPDADGIVRRSAAEPSPITTKNMPSLSSLLLQTVQGRPTANTPAEAEFVINYAGPNAFHRVSFSSLAAGEVPPALVADKLVLVGATAAGLGNIENVPPPAGRLMSGVEIQANILNTQLANAEIRTPSRFMLGLLSLLPLAILMAGFLRLSPAASFTLGAALAAVVLGLSFVLLPALHLWLPPATALGGLLLVHVLWGWRRLTVISRFVMTQSAQLSAEPGVVLSPHSRALGGDPIAAEAHRLGLVIDQIRTLRNFVAQAIESLPDAVCVVAPDGRIVLGNRAAARVFGETVTGRRIDEVTAILSAAPDGEQALLRDRDGKSFMQATSDLPDGSRIVSYADVTELQRIADERDDILQFLSHDIRSPNAAIVTLLETEQIASREPGTPPVTEATIEQIRLHARHALRLADDFVQLSRARRRPMQPDPIDLCDIAREAADMVWPRAGTRKISVYEGSAGGEIWIMGDRSMVLRATINLLENAVKFAPAGAVVTYVVEAVEERAILSVAGPGPAMPPGRAANPFALYAEGRAADGTGSLGLGLAFVQTTALRHDGLVTYNYRDGTGSEFRMIFPLAQAED